MADDVEALCSRPDAILGAVRVSATLDDIVVLSIVRSLVLELIELEAFVVTDVVAEVVADVVADLILEVVVEAVVAAGAPAKINPLN
jgi:hypothetical protein